MIEINLLPKSKANLALYFRIWKSLHPEYLQVRRDRARKRYATDPAFRARLKQNSHAWYQRNGITNCLLCYRFAYLPDRICLSCASKAAFVNVGIAMMEVLPVDDPIIRRCTVTTACDPDPEWA